MKLTAKDPEAKDYEVYKDGELIGSCVEADEEAGYAIVLGPVNYDNLFDPEYGYRQPFKIEGKIELKKIKDQTKFPYLREVSSGSEEQAVAQLESLQ